jgi:hypothetical protein
MANISSLPVEMVEVVAGFLSKRDIIALRSRCRTLRDGTNHEFCKRFFKGPFEITGSSVAIQGLLEILATPDFSSAKAFSQELVVYKPLAGDMPLGDKTTLPTAEEVNSLFAALPHLKALSIGAKETEPDSEEDCDTKETAALTMSRENLAPILLEGLAGVGSTTSRLTTLNLYDITIDGPILVEVVLAHKSSLEEVSFKLIKLQTSSNAVTWQTIFQTLLKLDLLQELTLELISDPAAKDCVLLNEESQDDNDWETYNSHQDMANVKRRGEEGVGEGDVTGYARYTRSKAHFFEDYASLGLKKLLRIGDFTVWPM